MLKRTIILLGAVLLLYVLSDWKRFKDHVRPMIDPIRNWTERQLDNGEDGPEAKVEWIEVDDLNDSPEPLREFNTFEYAHGEAKDSNRLASLREQLRELNVRDEKARRSRLQRIETELLEAEHEVELLERASATGDSSRWMQMDVKHQLSLQRVAQLRAMRDQLVRTNAN